MRIKLFVLALLLIAGFVMEENWRRSGESTGSIPTEPAKAPAAKKMSRGPAQPRLVRKDGRDSRNIPLSILALPAAEQSRRCLALNIYYEARHEPEAGMRMVGYVTDERAKLKRSYWGPTICEAVFRKDTSRKKRGKKWIIRRVCQFSWACMKGVQPNPRDFVRWTHALKIARQQLDGEYTPPAKLKKALYYLRPEHSSRNGRAFFRKLIYLDTVGHHKFYGEA